MLSKGVATYLIVALCGCSARVPAVPQEMAADTAKPPYEVVELNGEWAVRFTDSGLVTDSLGSCTNAKRVMATMLGLDASFDRHQVQRRSLMPWKPADCPPVPPLPTSVTMTAATYAYTNLSVSGPVVIRDSPEIILDNGTNVIAITYDGHVRLSNTNLDESARMFWSAVEKGFPEFIKSATNKANSL